VELSILHFLLSHRYVLDQTHINFSFTEMQIVMQDYRWKTIYMQEHECAFTEALLNEEVRVKDSFENL
jgi:hypothetical protein